MGLLRAGDPHGDVATRWQAKEAVRELYAHGDPDLALQCVAAHRDSRFSLRHQTRGSLSAATQWVEQLGADLQDADYPIEARSLGRTLIRWKHQIAAWHKAHVSNGPTEASTIRSNG